MHRTTASLLLGLSVLFLAVWPPGETVRAEEDRSHAPATMPKILLLRAAKASGQDAENAAACDAAKTVSAMLAEIGLDPTSIEEQAVTTEPLDRFAVVVLPYNPRLTASQAECLTHYVESGGKLFICYALDPRLAKVLGFAEPKYVRQSRPGHFAEMRFDSHMIPGLPASARQNSWNITAAVGTAYNTRNIGRWCDDAGQATGDWAVLLNDRGVLMSHLLLADDRENKKQLLAALLGQLAPSLWQQMAQFELQKARRVGHCASLDELSAFLTTKTNDSDALDRALAILKKPEEPTSPQACLTAIETARSAHDTLAKAYVRAVAAQSPPAHERRAVWNHSGMGAYPGDWERSAQLLADNGFTAVISNMLWGGAAHYASNLLPGTPAFLRHGDQLASCCTAAHNHGLEVHVWKVCFNLTNAPKDFVARLEGDGRTQVSVDGKPLAWLCPSHPENRKLERESLLEAAQAYPIDGLHLDYIRYPDRSHCFCDGCRSRFEAERGRAVPCWPADCFSGDLNDEYNDWRCRQITSLVAEVSCQAKRLRPQLKISAAVFGAYPDCRRSVAQDWPAWVGTGCLDFLCPMNYTADDNEFRALVENQLERCKGRIPLCVGIGATATGIRMPPDRVAGQIYLARSLGAAGFAIFDFTPTTAAAIVPALALPKTNE